MTNKIEAWAVVRLDGMLKQTYNSKKAANSAAIMFKAQSLSTTQPEDFKVVRLVEETQPVVEKPKVKMTQAEFDEWQKLYKYNYFKRAVFVLKAIEEDNFDNLHERFGEYIQDLPIFADLWVNYDPEHPEKTIEVEHNKKWFVRSKGFMRGDYTYSKLDRYGVIVQQTFEKSDAMSFDTQEEAEKWVNPLNEAVLLEIEE